MKKLLTISLIMVVVGMILSCNKNNDILKKGDEFDINEPESMDNLLDKIFSIDTKNKNSRKIDNDFPLIFIAYKYDKKTKKIIISEITERYEEKELSPEEEITLFASGLSWSEELKRAYRSNDGGGYVVTCIGGEHDGKVTNTDGKWDTGKAVGECLDGGGCASVCNARMLYSLETKTLYIHPDIN